MDKERCQWKNELDSLEKENKGMTNNSGTEQAIYNLGHNILRLFDVLPNFPFATSETNCDY